MFVLALIAVVLGPSIAGLIWFLFTSVNEKYDPERRPKIKKDFTAHYISTMGLKHKK